MWGEVQLYGGGRTIVKYFVTATFNSRRMDFYHGLLDAAQSGANQLKERYGSDSSQYKTAQSAIDAYGTKGIDNGGTIAQGRVGADTVQTIVNDSAGPKTAANLNGQQILVEFDKASNMLSGQNIDAVAALTAHEGVHVGAGSDWVTSGFSRAGEPTVLQGEHNAYVVEANVLDGFLYAQMNLSFGSRNYSFNLPLQQGSGDKIDAMIKRENPRWKLMEFERNTGK